MILGEVEETITSVEIDDETYEEIIKVRAFCLRLAACSLCSLAEQEHEELLSFSIMMPLLHCASIAWDSVLLRTITLWLSLSLRQCFALCRPTSGLYHFCLCAAMV